MSGIIGAISFKQKNIFPYLIAGMYGLQHRGQDGVGIAYFNQKEMCEIKGNGLLSDLNIETDYSNSGLGFLKYAFSEENKNIAMMPFRHESSFVAMDGNHLNSLKDAFVRLEITEDKLSCYRDPYGVKPLIIGQVDDIWIVSSESSAIESIGGTIYRDVMPGESITIDQDGFHSSLAKRKTARHCLFEMVYIAREDSIIDGVSVYDARLKMGEALYREYPIKADLVFGAPDSGMIPALGYAKASQIPYQKALVKNRYINRTFIEMDPKVKKENVNIKLSAVRSIIEGKRIVLVDDSIVRGFTIKRIVNVLKEAGAKEIHVLIASPPIKEEDNLSIDIPRKELLLAYNKSHEKIKKEINCDSLHFLSLEALKEACGQKGYYTRYFNGKTLEGDDDDYV